ncbi:MAG: LPP20 family lipoprotein [Spirochaetaceae bacterium]|nr:LPP20 family lipoprotein [Spirochaetaceae bacterium]MDT8297213.1 LPP20 family lipoprotein [Spirochaetaceae bacterium]
MRKVFGCFAILAVLLLAAGCAGGPDSGKAPSWLSSYPADPAYYVGIGGSSSGNLAEDRDKAAAAARADLAAQISAQISSELDVSSSSSSDGGFSESVERTVNESVEQNLKSVEVVDTWIDPDLGAWVYVRLSKAVWAAIVNEEVSNLNLRATGILEPVLNGGMTLAEDLAALGRARNVLISSPWGLSIKDALFGGGGFLLDQVDGQISDRTGSLSISAAAEPARVKYGTEIVLSGSVRAGSNQNLGAFPLVLSGADIRSSSFTTDALGGYTVTVSPEALEPGTVRFEIAPDLAAWSIPPEGFPVTRSAVEVAIDPILLAVSVASGAAPDLSVLDGAVRDWISELPLPAEAVAPGEGDVDLEFNWTVFDFPRSDRLANAPYITQVGAVLTVSRNNNVLLVREVEAFKDGGLDWNQAHQRSARGLLDKLAEDAQLIDDLVTALGL